jgi:2-keto-3-deoxy-L-rhamnonate aldolase RhmA
MAIRSNPVKAALRRGEIALGTMVFEFRTPGIGVIAARAGAEFVIFDAEHSAATDETLLAMIAGMRGVDAVPLVRVQTAQYPFISRVLDIGAMGVMVPMVESKEQAELIVRSAKYPPKGRRGAAFGVAHDGYEGGDLVETMRSSNEETLLIAQIETRDGVANLEAIGAVEGIDVLWIGHFDLTNALGIPGQFQHPDYIEALHKCVAIAKKYGKAAGFMASSPSEADHMIALGFHAIAYSGDIWIYQSALRENLEAIRSALFMTA